MMIQPACETQASATTLQKPTGIIAMVIIEIKEL